MKGPYSVIVLAGDGCWLSETEEETLKAAKASARDRLRDIEYIGAGAVKAEVRDVRGQCLYDVFADARQS